MIILLIAVKHLIIVSFYLVNSECQRVALYLLGVGVLGNRNHILIQHLNNLEVLLNIRFILAN